MHRLLSALLVILSALPLACTPRVYPHIAAPLPAAAPAVLEIDNAWPRAIDDFALLDAHGRFHQVSRYASSRLLVLYVQGNGCPIVRQNLAALTALRERYEPSEVRFLLFNANPQDDRLALLEEIEAFSIELPILRDASQLVAEALSLERTGEALVIDPSGLQLLWRGPLDDRLEYGAQKAEAQREFLAEALDALLEGGAPPSDVPAAKGCAITFQQPQARHQVDYAEDIAGLLEARCVDCHQRGGAAPFAMRNHASVQGWSAMIEEAVLTRRMPPWHADPDHGSFAGDASLSVEEQRKLVHWVRAGAPGSESDPLADREAELQDWPEGEPDLVIEIEAQEVPATGVLGYREFYLPEEIVEDRWVKGVVFLPSEPEVMHHAFVFARFPKHLRHLQERSNGGLSDFFGAYVPGMLQGFFPEDTGKRLPAGTRIKVQLHYTTNGRPLVDKPRIGLYFHDEPPEHELRVASAVNRRLDIPPRSPETRASASRIVPVDAVLYGMIPHMHFRGSWMRFTLRRPDGSEELLLSVPQYDMFWQRQYMLSEPLAVPAGSTIEVEGAFDNSAGNPLNPDPSQRLHFGQQTTDEMFIGYLLYRLD